MRANSILLIGASFVAVFLLKKITKRQDKNIPQLIEEVMYKGFAEIQNSKLALEKSNSTNIKIFAQRMIDDHIALNQKLTDIARAKGIPTPEIERHLDAVEPYLASYRNDESFDECYVDHQLTVHRDVVKLFRKIGASDDPEINQFATQAVEHLGHHLRMAQDLADTFHTNNIPTSSPYQNDFVEEPNYKT
jgi:putative membrane protein